MDPGFEFEALTVRQSRLTDNLDLNGDRSNEIVRRVGGQESEEYQIYARQLGKWQLVVNGDEAGC